MKKFLSLLFIFVAVTAFGGNKIAFDLSHGQFQDVFVDPSYYDYVLPAYREICSELGAEYAEIKEGITESSLRDVTTLVMLSPLARSTQKAIKEEEKAAILAFIERGGSVLIFVDEEEYRVILEEYGVNDITKKFGIELGDDIVGLPGNCGAVSFENEIFGGRREIPYSGSRKIKGGIPAAVCMEGGWLHSSFVKTDNGGKLYVAGETMVALLMGQNDGERNVHKKMESKWWGKDSRLFMTELLRWSLKKEENTTAEFKVPSTLPSENGVGEIKVEPVFDLSELNGKIGMYARVTIPPGAKLGFHEHHGNGEGYFVLSGEAIYTDNKKGQRVLKAGDITFTPDGSGHGVDNSKGKVPFVFLALIVLK